MEFLVEFEVEVPAGTPDTEVEQHQRAESAATAELAEDGHLVRLWRRPLIGDGTTAIGPCRADSEAAFDGLLAALPLADRLRVTVTPLEAYPTIRRRPLDERPASRPFPDPGSTASKPPWANRSTSATSPRAAGASCRWPAGDLCQARAEREAASGLERRLADRPPRRNRPRRHPLHAPDRRRRSALCPITEHAPRPPPHPAPTEPPVTYGYKHQEAAITIRLNQAGTRASYASGGGGASRVPRIAGDVTAGSALVSCVLVGYAPCAERRPF